MKPISFTLTLLFLFLFNTSEAQRKKANASNSDQKINSSLLSGLKLRNISPGHTGGRVVDIAVDPNNKSIRYAAIASGNVWKTSNNGTTWKPIFDRYGSFSVGIVTIDPNDSQTIWVGTGENNSQRSVSMGDGVYKSTDGGKSFKNMGLKNSAHIGKILVHPENSHIVYVAAQGPLWSDGGDRGLYKTIDGGENWKRVLFVSEKSGISDVVQDPRNPDILYASAYQRRRHVGMLVAGGPDNGVFKSTDGGKNWKKLKTGLPSGDLGRIGLAISPINPDILYAIIAGTEETKGFYRSANQGERWQKMNDYMVVDAQYYMELFPDPHQLDKVYVVDVRIHVTEDGGKTFSLLPENRKHVDSHEIVFDKDDPNYIMVGCDGGIYESWDKGATWRHTQNIPLTQFYRVGIDNAEPFYNVYGGTQDNNTLGGPSRTTNSLGILNSDWYYTLGGDGFQARIDPEDPNTVYCMSQYAGIVRYNKGTGERIDIQPQPDAGEPPLRWHWDSPLIISPHNSKRLYFAANKLFRSDDRGNSWTAISGDLSQNLDRNKMKIMDRVWGIDAIFKNVWTSPLSTIVSLDESPVQEGLIYVGTDDGLIQVTEDGGQSWKKIEKFTGVPSGTYVADVHASRHDPSTVFAVFNNHKNGDFKPYILKSTNKGQNWIMINNDLPDRDFGWSIYQDHENADLLFLGTEYGLYTSLNGGISWIKFTSGIPTIAIRDLEIQQRENDLVAASFGRGFYILDDYSPLRILTEESLNQEAFVFPVKDTWLYLENNPTGSARGHSLFSSPNPTYGAVFTYYLQNSFKKKSQIRKEAEQQKVKAGEAVYYPEWDDFTAEKREEAPQIIFTIKDRNKTVVNRISTPAKKGLHRVPWNMRYSGRPGAHVLPGDYTVSMAVIHDGEWRDLGQEQSFKVKSLYERATNDEETLAFNKQVSEFMKNIAQVNTMLNEAVENLKGAKQAIIINANESEDLYKSTHNLQIKLMDFQISLNGNRLIVDKMELIPPNINSRANRIRRNFWSTLESPTQTQKDSYQIAEKEFEELIDQINSLIEKEFSTLGNKLKEEGVSYMLKVPEKIGK